MEYRVASGWKIFIGFFAIALLASGLYLIAFPFISPKHQYVLCVIGVLLVVFAYYAYREITISKIILNEDEITVANSISVKSLSMDYIKGYRIGEKNALLIISKDENAKPLQISSYFENYNEIKEWVQNRLHDVDAIMVEQETKEILAGEQFGNSVQEREDNLRNAKKFASVINWAAGIAFIWGFLYPKPYEIPMCILLTLPFIGSVVARRFKGLIKLVDNKKSAYPTINFAFLLPASCLFIRALLDYDLYSFSPMLKPALIIFLIVIIIWFAICRDTINLSASKNTVIFTLIALALCYAYGATVFINGYYDHSKAEVFSIQVKDKHISSGKHTSYYLTVDPWGRFEVQEDLSVSKKLYYSIEISDTVKVYLHQGKLAVPWYSVRRN